MTLLRKMKSVLLRFKVSFWVTQGYKTQKTTIIFYMLAFKIFFGLFKPHYCCFIGEINSNFRCWFIFTKIRSKIASAKYHGFNSFKLIIVQILQILCSWFWLSVRYFIQSRKFYLRTLWSIGCLNPFKLSKWIANMVIT